MWILLKCWTCFTHCVGVSFVEFEQVNAGWVVFDILSGFSIVKMACLKGLVLIKGRYPEKYFSMFCRANMTSLSNDFDGYSRVGA